MAGSGQVLYSDGLLKLDRDSGVIKNSRFSEQVNILTFDFLDDGEFLAGTNSGLVFCRFKESGEIEIIRHVSEIPESKITCIQRIRSRSGFYYRHGK